MFTKVELMTNRNRSEEGNDSCWCTAQQISKTVV